MAECVHQNLEGMLPELEEMESTGIFTRDEIRSILKQRTDFEYRLQRRIVQKGDFLKYMQYELNLDQLRKRRKLKFGLRKTTEGEHSAVKRLHLIFQKALKKFRGDVKMWLQYIEFCKHMGSTKVLGKVYARILQFHPHNPKLWIMAAKWEFEENHSIPAARTLLQRSLRMISDSKLLWLEYFRMELLHLDKVRKRRQVLGLAGIDTTEEDDPVSDEFLTGKIAEIVYNKAIENIPDDVDFRLAFLQVYRLFPHTKTNQDKVYDSLLRDFPKSEVSWDVLARRPIEDMKSSVDNQTAIITDPQWVDAEEERDRIFTKAVQEISTAKMWEYYLKAHIEELDNSSTALAERRVNRILKIFVAAEKEGMLSEPMYIEWANVLIHTGETFEALSVYSRATEKYSNSVRPWLEFLKLKLLLQGAGYEDVHKEFSVALKAVSKKESLPLWQLWLDHYVTHDSEETLILFEKAVTSCDKVAAVMKERYVEWMALYRGIKAARELYKRLSQVKPVTLSFFKKCLELEQGQMYPSAKRLRKLYNMSLDEFGETEPDLWLNYIRFERSYPGGIPENAAKIHWRAMKTLRSDHTSKFVTSYSLLQSGNT